MGPDASSGGERIRRNVNISGRRTSVSLEAAVWDALADICKRERVHLVELFTRIDSSRHDASLASALRVFVLTYFRTLSEVGLGGGASHGSMHDGHDAGVLSRAFSEFTSARRASARPGVRARR